ncbi:urease subunit gamma [Streptomyces sp. NPDC088747]|uniref:urease subunit gamma n=1 Tax=Streptomyces sp. NPDC088747 TaxID=3365886 RepID=UPI00381297C2
MHLTPHEQERLMIRVAADLAGRRLRRQPDLALNYPEVMALLAAYVLEEARHDTKTVAELMDTKLSDVAKSLKIPSKTRGVDLTDLEVMDGVREMIRDVQVEATFKDGTKLVTIPDPLGKADPDAEVYPGKYELLADDGQHAVTFNADDHADSLGEGPLWAKNTAKRPIQVGSHFHLGDVNACLKFFKDEECTDPADVKGKRLHIAAGTSERIEPEHVCRVWVVPIKGAQLVKGLRVKDSSEWTVAP